MTFSIYFIKDHNFLEQRVDEFVNCGMPRATGQIDTRKSEAILEAAAAVLAVRGLSAPIEEIARRAGVSKQTIYNHFGSKIGLVRVITTWRLSQLTAVLDQRPTEMSLEGVLSQYAAAIISAVTLPISIQMTRVGIASAAEMPDLARTIYDAGARASGLRLAQFLRAAGADELDIPDVMEASEIFTGMVLGRLQLRLLYGLDSEIHDPQSRAQEVAHRFVKAYKRVR